MKLNSILLCILVSITANSFTTAKAQVNTTDSLALVDLYNSTNGPNWTNHTNWLTTNPVSTWYGIEVSGSRVVRLNVYANNLVGSIPSSIGNFTNLNLLFLHFNQLSGSIPAQIGNLVNVKDFNLSNNQLSGSIPVEIGNLANVNYIQLGVNQLSGTIPVAFGNLAKLEILDLSGNQLSGSIPAALSQAANLSSLVLTFNQLSGIIPAEIGNLPNMEFLILNNNQLSGSIPAQIGNLSALYQLDLSNNQLSGTIPAEFGNLVNDFHDLRLDNNHLSGNIPAAIGNLANLSYLTLSNNQLNGEVPASFRNLKRLSFVNLSHNQLVQNSNINADVPVNARLKGYITYNLFNFDELQFIAQKYPAIHYAQQNTVLPIHQNGSTLSVYAGGFLKKNTYTWYKVGTTESTVIKHDSTFMPTESGSYYVVVKNAIAQKTKLHSDTINFVLPALTQKSNLLTAKTMQPATIIKRMQVFPNPATNSIHLQTNGTATITLTNSTGKTVLTKTINNSDIINVSSFAGGTYYIQNKTTGEVQKIVVVH